MPSVLLTTSRRTSNRVRSFVRDLHFMLPDSERFNRGGMSLRELVSRIRGSGASACILTSLYKGNPGSMQFILPSGEVLLILRIESAILRREINPKSKFRATTLSAISIDAKQNDNVKLVANAISSLLGLEVIESYQVPSLGKQAKSQVVIRLVAHGQEQLSWTFHEMAKGSEIGPRIRVGSVKVEKSIPR